MVAYYDLVALDVDHCMGIVQRIRRRLPRIPPEICTENSGAAFYLVDNPSPCEFSYAIVCMGSWRDAQSHGDFVDRHELSSRW